MATKKRKKKRGGGRHDRSGVLSGINPQKEEWSDIRNRIIYGHPEWRMVRLRELIGDGSKLGGNFLSARSAEHQAKARAKGYVLLDEIDSLWNTLSAQFERAVLDGDAEWFERQAKAIRWHDSRTELGKARAHFSAEVIRRFETEFWSTHSKQKAEREKEREKVAERSYEGRAANQPKRQAKIAALIQSLKLKPVIESATLTPAGKFTDAKARQILESFHPRKDTKPLTDKEKKFIRWHEDERWNHAEIEDMIGKSYTRNKDSELIAVSKRGGALIVEWKDRTQKFTHRFKTQRCALDAIRDIANRLRLA